MIATTIDKVIGGLQMIRDRARHRAEAVEDLDMNAAYPKAR